MKKALMVLSGELVSLLGEAKQGFRLDTHACAVLSRLIYSKTDRCHLFPDMNWPPYTHVLILSEAVFRVVVEELTPEEEEAVGLCRFVSPEEADAVVRRPNEQASVAVGISPGEVVQDMISRGMPGWCYVP